MVSILIVSHSYSLAKGVKEIGLMMAPDITIEDAGGIDEFTLGTSYERIREKILNVYTKDGLLILADMGSSIMTTQMVLEELNLENVIICDCPLVEGTIKAAIDCSLHKTIEEIKLDWNNCILNKQ